MIVLLRNIAQNRIIPWKIPYDPGFCLLFEYNWYRPKGDGQYYVKSEFYHKGKFFTLKLAHAWGDGIFTEVATDNGEVIARMKRTIED